MGRGTGERERGGELQAGGFHRHLWLLLFLGLVVVVLLLVCVVQVVARGAVGYYHSGSSCWESMKKEEAPGLQTGR